MPHADPGDPPRRWANKRFGHGTPAHNLKAFSTEFLGVLSGRSAAPNPGT
ncbi:MAG TPA: hypothetical protein VGH33_18115 [Isosphaeraceae bacterium]